MELEILFGIEVLYILRYNYCRKKIIIMNQNLIERHTTCKLTLYNSSVMKSEFSWRSRETPSTLISRYFSLSCCLLHAECGAGKRIYKANKGSCIDTDSHAAYILWGHACMHLFTHETGPYLGVQIFYFLNRPY